MTVQTFRPDTVITLTPAAATHLQQQLETTAASAIRVSVKATGCSGYAYVVDAVHTAQQDDVVIRINDQLTLFVDAQSLPMIRGMEIDFVKDGINRNLQFNKYSLLPIVS